MNVNLCGGKFHGRVHVTHVCDEVAEVRISVIFFLKVHMAQEQVAETSVCLLGQNGARAP